MTETVEATGLYLQIQLCLALRAPGLTAPTDNVNSEPLSLE